MAEEAGIADGNTAACIPMDYVGRACGMASPVATSATEHASRNSDEYKVGEISTHQQAMQVARLEDAEAAMTALPAAWDSPTMHHAPSADAATAMALQQAEQTASAAVACAVLPAPQLRGWTPASAPSVVAATLLAVPSRPAMTAHVHRLPRVASEGHSETAVQAVASVAVAVKE